MPGHISEKRWADTSDEVNRKLQKLMQFIVESEDLYQELVQLWQYNGGPTANQAVANQLFQGDPASAAELGMAVDMRAALIAAHDIFLTADLAAIRKMT